MDLVEPGKCLPYRFMLVGVDNGHTLPQRMARRLEAATEFPVLFAVFDWRDDGGKYAAGTTMHWGAESRQYIQVQKGSLYYLVGTSNCGWH